MQREITVKEVAETLNEYDNVDEPIVVKRNNKNNLFIVDQNYLDRLKDLEVINSLLRSQEDKKNGKVKPARQVLKELRKIYG